MSLHAVRYPTNSNIIYQHRKAFAVAGLRRYKCKSQLPETLPLDIVLRSALRRWHETTSRFQLLGPTAAQETNTGSCFFAWRPGLRHFLHTSRQGANCLVTGRRRDWPGY